MFGFGFPWRLIGILLLFVIVGGTIYAGYKYVENLQTKVEHFQSENLKLDLAIKGKEKEIKQLRIVQKDIKSQTDAAQKSDQESRRMVFELETKIKNKERLAREEKIEASDRAGLYLKFTKNFEKCLSEHYDDFNGKCDFLGRFILEKKP